jgi:hypothetical protein
MKLESVKKFYAEDMHTNGPDEDHKDASLSTLDIRSESPDGDGFYCVINATELAFCNVNDVDAFAERIKAFMREFCQ